MKKILISTCLALGMTTVMADDEPDNRSDWAKSQDMHVEPTFKIKESTVVVTPEEAAQQGLSVQEVPSGTYQPSESLTVIDSSGNRVTTDEAPESTEPATPSAESQPAEPQQTEPEPSNSTMPQPAEEVEDNSTMPQPTQEAEDPDNIFDKNTNKPEIDDLSRDLSN